MARPAIGFAHYSPAAPAPLHEPAPRLLDTLSRAASRAGRHVRFYSLQSGGDRAEHFASALREAARDGAAIAVPSRAHLTAENVEAARAAGVEIVAAESLIAIREDRFQMTIQSAAEARRQMIERSGGDGRKPILPTMPATPNPDHRARVAAQVAAIQAQKVQDAAARMDGAGRPSGSYQRPPGPGNADRNRASAWADRQRAQQPAPPRPADVPKVELRGKDGRWRDVNASQRLQRAHEQVAWDATHGPAAPVREDAGDQWRFDGQPRSAAAARDAMIARGRL